MSLQSRRGFLQTISAALVGAAVFDPKSLLWVPGSTESVAPVVLGGMSPQAAIDLQLELNDLARQVAVRLGETLSRSRATALRQVMYQHAGHVRLVADEYKTDVLDVTGIGRGRFAPAYARISAGATLLRDGHERQPSLLAGDLGNKLRNYGGDFDMFAPIAAELRPGVPFTPDVAIGIGTDPATGLSVRAMRFKQGGRDGGWHTTVEVAGGHWVPERAEQAPCPLCGEPASIEMGEERSPRPLYYCAECGSDFRVTPQRAPEGLIV